MFNFVNMIIIISKGIDTMTVILLTSNLDTMFSACGQN